MHLYAAWLKFKNRFADTTGAITQEYALTSVIALAIVTIIIKVVESEWFMNLVKMLVELAINFLPGLLKLLA